MTVAHSHRNASIDEIAAEMDRRGTVIESLEAQVSSLRAKLSPYADATEISGISWDGKYLIGDKASITFFHEMKNRGEQIDVYKRAYDQNLAAKDAQIAKLSEDAKDLREALRPFAKVFEHDIGSDEADADLFQVINNNRAPKLTVGDFRLAYGALFNAECLS